jgi:hypothetical protein
MLRSIAAAAAGTTAWPMVASTVWAAQATPDATPAPEALPPEVIFDRLLESTITSPLFPSDTPGLTVIEWDDASDDDLDGVVGGLLVQSGSGDDDPLVGVYIVHPAIAMARERIDIQTREPGGTTQRQDLFGYQGVWQHELPNPTAHIEEPGDRFSLLGVAVGPVIVSAVGEGGDLASNNVRALANLSGMLDHLRSTTVRDEAG